MKTDQELVNNFLSNRSAGSFSDLYDHFTMGLLRTAMYLTGRDRMLADDLLQEVWIVAVQKLEEFKGQSSLKTWLTGILINKFRESQRKLKRTDDITAANEVMSAPTTGDLAMDLKNVLLRLPEGYRQILVLHDMEGFKHREIAAMLEVDDGTSKSQLFQARKAMRNLLQEYK